VYDEKQYQVGWQRVAEPIYPEVGEREVCGYAYGGLTVQNADTPCVSPHLQHVHMEIRVRSELSFLIKLKVPFSHY
jgi:hypothetical protein